MSFGIQLVPAALLAVFMVFRPESPRWLVRHDRQEDALQVLANLHANGDTQDPVPQSELQEIATNLSVSASGTKDELEQRIR